MHDAVNVRELKRRTTDYVAQASGGDPVLVMRNSRLVAILRPAKPGEVIPRHSVRDLHRHAGRLLRAAQDRPLVIVWYGQRAAVLAPIPPELAQTETAAEGEE
jgi:hypothetical protein